MLISKLELQTNYIYNLDNFYTLCDDWTITSDDEFEERNNWQTELVRITIVPTYQIYLQYLQIKIIFVIGDNGSMIIEISDNSDLLEDRLNKIVNNQDEFKSTYVYDCFSLDLLDKFTQLGIIFAVTECRTGDDT